MHKQVIKDLPDRPTKKIDAPKTYCLLTLFSTDKKEIGPMINIGSYDNPKWFVFEVTKKFSTKEEAEDYAKKHAIKLAYDAVVD